MGNHPDPVVAVDRGHGGCRVFLGWELYRTLTELEDVEM